MEGDDYKIKEGRFDISDTATVVSLSKAGGTDKGKFVLKLESEDGSEVSIVMSFIQTIALRSMASRVERGAKGRETKSQGYDTEAPSLFPIECEVEVSLSDGRAKTLREIIRDVVFGLALPMEQGSWSNDRRFSETVGSILIKMAEDGRVEHLGTDAYRMTGAVLAEMRAKEFRDQTNEVI